MNKRMYGVIGVRAVMANWNADFTGYPKTTSNGSIFGSDKAVKYPMKRMWLNEGKKVMYTKTFTEKKETKFIPRTLQERYDYVFETDLKSTTNKVDVLKNLLTAIDVKNFGATFAEAGANISITGAVQIGQGFNKYDDTEVQEQQILSPFRDPKGTTDKETKEKTGEASQSTLGTKIVVDEAHYFYPFVINPSVYDEFVELGVTAGYTEEDYVEFKRVACASATAHNSNSKFGCENEFSLFIETQQDVYLPDIAQYMTFEKGVNKDTISFEITPLLESLGDKVLKVEVYYNPLKLDIHNAPANTTYFNIFTQEEIVA
ncbi:MAG: CRISPR-associated protein [Epulopiscium sp. Nele67-Bin004]|nr:MAG: CRISPR-associated protein [Epulopiscium sp. Nele67-Bin004]